MRQDQMLMLIINGTAISSRQKVVRVIARVPDFFDFFAEIRA